MQQEMVGGGGDGTGWNCQDVQSSSHITTTSIPSLSLFAGRMSFLWHNQQCQSTEGKVSKKAQHVMMWDWMKYEDFGNIPETAASSEQWFCCRRRAIPRQAVTAPASCRRRRRRRKFICRNEHNIIYNIMTYKHTAGYQRGESPSNAGRPGSCIGCQSNSGSHTSWQFWHTNVRARPLRFTYTTESQNVPAAKLHVHLPSRCWTNRSWEETSPSVLSGFQHRPVWNSLSQTVLISDSLSVFNLDLNLFCSIRLSLNTDPTCRQRLWSYDRMTL